MGTNTEDAVMRQTLSFHEAEQLFDNTVTCICTHRFSQICHFRPMTQPNPLKTKILDPYPTQANPTQPNWSTQPMDNSELAKAEKRTIKLLQ